MIVKKKWDEKGKNNAIWSENYGRKKHIISETKKRESKKQQFPKKIRFDEFWEEWRLSHSRGKLVLRT